jgi:hypothetical protein
MNFSIRWSLFQKVCLCPKIPQIKFEKQKFEENTNFTGIIKNHHIDMHMASGYNVVVLRSKMLFFFLIWAFIYYTYQSNFHGGTLSARHDVLFSIFFLNVKNV